MVHIAVCTFLLLCLLSKLKFVKTETGVFNQCIRSSPNPGMLRCIGQQALSSLHNFNKLDNVTLSSGFMMIRNEDMMQRSLPDFFTEDPLDFRCVICNLCGRRRCAVINVLISNMWFILLKTGVCLRTLAHWWVNGHCNGTWVSFIRVSVCVLVRTAIRTVC